jgi:hypothetical protein
LQAFQAQKAQLPEQQQEKLEHRLPANPAHQAQRPQHQPRPLPASKPLQSKQLPQPNLPARVNLVVAAKGNK